MRLSHALSHSHAKDKADLALVLLAEQAQELQPRGWRLRAIKGGANSWMLANGQRQYHFRDGGTGTINVYDRYFHGYDPKCLVATLTTRVDVLRFIRKCIAES
jgi:hypothetical protein